MSNEKHNPDEAEIRRECLKIQATWSKAERRRRNCYPRASVEAAVVAREQLEAALKR